MVGGSEIPNVDEGEVSDTSGGVSWIVVIWSPTVPPAGLHLGFFPNVAKSSSVGSVESTPTVTLDKTQIASLLGYAVLANVSCRPCVSLEWPVYQPMSWLRTLALHGSRSFERPWPDVVWHTLSSCDEYLAASSSKRQGLD